ncbi:phosphoribosylformylglycinamidine synthase subunit II [Halohasta litchfieldiae]|jgi:phosphoribosylformylglycinamidine synthase|uniref:Phosphoribosylformylglycinamidine synthase subunit PurL n=1 Tax=Halohasta litchfieldiae TaxID=1073996 RepID=A0A1H6UWX5_9EURY|nr:phosphoribosylformylglycinamidine synthase subunit PurL [Halohasta litchfieldiae]ATW89442.1 phosphoribosylformylglycinamidine synthase subunit II [Halohasta litchfieldiae]SEI92462.1 phosphoribosylformylglycinamidine synthase subunit II [Halohasta litchfieldiae]
MSLPDSDHQLVVDELGREPTAAEAVLFENLWSEHCAYRSSRPLLSAFDSEGEGVVIGPGDDAAVVAVPEPDAADTPADDREASDYSDTYITLGIESHNHPSYVDPYDGAATGVGGIVRDTMSMGAYPIALADSLYFGTFDREHSQYLFEGVVEGISNYGNSIGVPTVTGSVDFHEGYVGNPLVNVACVGLTNEERLVTAEAQTAGNKLVLVGNGTGRDGLGGASFASEDLAEDAETEDRPAVQVGDPYTEKLLIEANEMLVDENLLLSARDLGAAGLGGASSELVAKGGFGAEIDLNKVHQREPNMNALEILLAESQERMCYEVAPEDTDRVAEIAERFDLGCSVIGEVREGNYVCTFDGETVVDVDPEFLAEGAPMNDLEAIEPEQPGRELPDVDLEDAINAVVSAPNTASKRWVYRQYDHEVGVRTALKPGDDTAIMAIRETSGDANDTTGAGTGLAFSSGSNPNWTTNAPYEGAQAVALENATNIAAKGALPLTAVNCLNGGNPEKPDVYGGFKAIVDGLAEMCSDLSTPVVGGNVSLYNDSTTGPIPPTPTLAMVGSKAGYDAPPAALSGEGELLVVGSAGGALGGSEYLAQVGGSDGFPALPANASEIIETIATVANQESTLASHDVSHGGLAVALAELITADAGAEVSVDGVVDLFDETPGRVVIETTDPAAVREAFDGVAPVDSLGSATDDGTLSLTVDGETVDYDSETVTELRAVITETLD